MEPNVTPYDNLKARILQLEAQRAEAKVLLLEEVDLMKESLKPLNLLKTTFKDVASSPDLKNHIADTLMGIAVGWVSRKVVVGGTHNPLKKILGSVLQFGVTNVVSNNYENIKSTAIDLYDRFIKKDNKGIQKNHELNGSKLKD